MLDKAEIHRKVVSGNVVKRREATWQLCNDFADLPDKDDAWDDLHRLTKDKDSSVRLRAADALGCAFQHVPKRKEAWRCLHRLTVDGDIYVRRHAADALGIAFQHIPDKMQAWGDLIRLTADGDIYVRRHAADALGSAFPHVPDKMQAWGDLIRLTQDKNEYVWRHATDALGSAFPHVPDKMQAWGDLIRLTQDKNEYVWRHATDALGSAFPHVPDKEQVWGDLIRLTQDKNEYVWRHAAKMLDSAFQHVIYIDEALKDLHRLTADEDDDVRTFAADALGIAFQHIPDKMQAWGDLIWLTADKDDDVRRHAADALGIAFQHVPDKTRAWHDLCRLTEDEYWNVRRHAADALGIAFQHIPDKMQAWGDLIRLTADEDNDVRRHAADALGIAFQHVPDKTQAWHDLRRLTEDEGSYVRASANNSLGRASISKATEAENEERYREELKNALEFFEKSSNEATYLHNPSRFCLPFYRSLYSLTFEKAVAKSEVQKYLTEAKSASEGSKNKELLLEAVENLANALSEAQKATDFDVTKSDLKAYMQYCDRAADLISDAAEGAPGAARVLRRGLPIIGERIKEIIREIQERAGAVCRKMQGTPLEALGLTTYISAQELPTQDPLALTMALGSMASIARGWCEYLPTDKKADACEQLKSLPDTEILEQVTALARVFDYVQENIHIPKIQTVHISDMEHEIVKIAVAQISFELTESFPFVLKNKDEVKTKVFSALEIAKQDSVDIVCLPELCIYEEWINEIKGKYPDMIVIGGSFYKDNKNICSVIMESDTGIPFQPKITPSPFEDGIMGSRMILGDRIYRYETRFGKFVILICMDFDDLAHFFREADIDMIFCPAFNSANERFHEEANSHVKKTPSYILIANTGLYGGTSIFGQLNNKYFGGLADGGCKERGDSTYKLCEVKKGQEEVIIADFNLNHKGAQVPIPSNPNKVIKSVDHIRKIPIQPDRSRI